MSKVMTLLTSATGHALVKSFSGTDVALQRWSRIFGPVVKVDCMTKEVIPNDKTKEPFARFQSQGCA